MKFLYCHLEFYLFLLFCENLLDVTVLHLFQVMLTWNFFRVVKVCSLIVDKLRLHVLFTKSIERIKIKQWLFIELNNWQVIISNILSSIIYLHSLWIKENRVSFLFILLTFVLLGLKGLNQLIFVKVSSSWFIKKDYFRLGVFCHVLHRLLLKYLNQKVQNLLRMGVCSFCHLWNTFDPSLGDVSPHTGNTLSSEFLLHCLSLSHKDCLDFGSLSIVFSCNLSSLRSIYVIHSL